MPRGAHRWPTVVLPVDRDGVELVLEPDEHPAAKPFKIHAPSRAARAEVR